MSTKAALTSKGQTTISKQIRNSLGMKAGDRISLTLLAEGTVLMRIKSKSAMDLADSLYKKGRKLVPMERLSR